MLNNKKNYTTDGLSDFIGMIMGIVVIVGILFVVIHAFYDVGVSNTDTITVQVEIVDTVHHNTGVIHMPQYLREYEVAVRYKNKYYSVYVDNVDDFYTYKKEIGKQVSATLETKTYNNGSTSLAITKIGE